jgi:nucleotide-binding universal stress UspA family protein
MDTAKSLYISEKEAGMKILVAYDGTLNAKKALRYGMEKVKERGGELTLLGVFKSSMFIDYGAGPKAEGMARSEFESRMKEAEGIIAEGPEAVKTEVLAKAAESEEEAADYAEDSRAELVLAPPGLRSLAKISHCPVCIIPGNILVPVDNTEGPLREAERIAKEALATGSQVVILGVIPVHIYSRHEKEELDKIRKDTGLIARELAKKLGEMGVKTVEAKAEGFPDEEIMKAAEKHSASMLIIPSLGEEPSELTKAASIIADEPSRMRKPVMVIPQRPA